MAMVATKRTNEQNKKIWGLVKQLAFKMGHEKVSVLKLEVCLKASGQEHTSELSYFQAEDMIERLQAKLSEYEKTEKNLSGMNGAVTREGKNGDAVALVHSPRTGLSGMRAWIEMSYNDLFTIDKIDEPAREIYKKRFNKRICRSETIDDETCAHKVYEALKAVIVRKIKHEDLLEKVETSIKLYFDKMTAWEQGAMWDYRSQLMKAGKLDSPAKIKKALEIYYKYAKK